jgi:predicted secreted protein
MIGVGQQFAVLLHSNPSTGYGWTAQFDAKALSQVSKTYESSQATPMPGSGGTDRFLFQGLTAGPADLKFTYARSFDPPGTAPAQTMIFKVTVK